MNEGHGGLDSTLGEAGEGLTVADPEEVWIFHILPDPTGASAIWAAQRIPPNHITARSNSFVILDVLENDENFLYSDNLFEVAESRGWWSRASNKPLNFAKVRILRDVCCYWYKGVLCCVCVVCRHIPMCVIMRTGVPCGSGGCSPWELPP